jgi:hypothetical protein
MKAAARGALCLSLWVWCWLSEAFVIHTIKWSIGSISEPTIVVGRIAYHNNLNAKFSSMAGSVIENIVAVCPSPQISMRLAHFHEIKHFFRNMQLFGGSSVVRPQEGRTRITEVLNSSSTGSSPARIRHCLLKFIIMNFVGVLPIFFQMQRKFQPFWPLRDSFFAMNGSGTTNARSVVTSANRPNST